MSANPGANPPREAPKLQYNVELDGQVVNLIEGLSPDDLAAIEDQLATDESVAEGGANAAPEAAAPKPVPQPPVADVKTPEVEHEPEIEAATPPPELKFVIKRHGKEVEIDLSNDPDRLKTLVSLGFDYTQKTQELARDRDFVSAHKQVLESEAFKEFLAQAQADGRIPPPQPPPVVDKAAVTEYALRKLDPDFDLVRERMAAVASQLGPEVEALVDGDHGAFVRMYDRIAPEVRNKKEAAPAKPPAPSLDAKVAEKILKTKEVLKAQAVVESPGTAPSEGPSEIEKWKKEDDRLSRRYKQSKSDEDAIALVMHRQYMPAR